MAARRLAMAGLLAALGLLAVPPASRAEEWPSLFRGVVVADGSTGIRVVSVEPASMAAEAGLRPEDIILQIGEHSLSTIDEFAVLSKALKGRTDQTRVVVLRNGQPRNIALHIYSYPLLRHWDVRFVPDYELRFVDPGAARSYWTNLGRGFEEAGQAEQAVSADLNVLHHVPDDLELALKVSQLWTLIVRRHLEAGRLPDAVRILAQQTSLLNRLFDHPVSTEQLETVRAQLTDTLTSLQAVRSSTPTTR